MEGGGGRRWRLVLLLRERNIGVRAGRARGAGAPPNFEQLRFFGRHEKFGQSQFLKTSACFYCSFKEINIFHFLLPESGVIIQLHWHETVAA